MPLRPQPLLVLHDEPTLRRRVHLAAPEMMEVVQVRDWEALRTAASTAAPGTVAVVDPYHGTRDGDLAQPLKSLAGDFPHLPLVAASRALGERHFDVVTLGAWGVDDVLRIGDADRGPAFASRLYARRAAYFARLLAAVVPPRLPGLHRARISSALEIAAGWGGAAEWARSLELSPQQLLRTGKRAGLLPPRRMLAWMRVLLAVDLLGSRGHTIGSVAAACGYYSYAPLRRAVTQITGAELPALLAESAPLTFAAARFAADLAAHRAMRESR